MKTLAVIKNDLFKDYLRFVSTSDLPSVLDNPDIPVPLEALLLHTEHFFFFQIFFYSKSRSHGTRA